MNADRQSDERETARGQNAHEKTEIIADLGFWRFRFF